MRKIMRLLSICLVLTLVFAGMPVAEARTAEGFIRVDGQKLVDENGKEYQIRAMANNNAWSKWEQTIERARKEHDEASFQELQQMGFNASVFSICVEYFEDDEGWEWMDENIAWAKKYGLRLIPKLTIFEGAIVDDKGIAFWSDQTVRQEYIDFWQTFADRYANETAILGYDLCNEPQVWVPGGGIEAALNAWKEVANDMISAIRMVDSNHMIFLQGMYSVVDSDTKQTVMNYNPSKMSHLFFVKDSNTVYEFHNYYPTSFTMQNMDWHGSAGLFMEYPSYDVDLSNYEWAWGGSGDYYTQANAPSEWERMSVEYIGADNVHIGEVLMRAEGLNDEALVYFDHFVLSEYDEQGHFVRNILDESFDSQDASYSVAGGQAVFDANAGVDGSGCIIVSNTAASAANNIHLGRYVLEAGHKYILSMDVKCSNLTSGFIAPSFSLFLKKADGSSYIDKQSQEKELQRQMAFGDENHVPVFMGEFGVGCYAFDENRGGETYIRDILELCSEYGLHYAHVDYHSDLFGLWESPSHETRTNLNELKRDALIIGNELNTELEVITSCAERMDESTALIELDNTKKTTVYAAVVEAGEDKPTIDTSGDGIAVGANGDSFTLDIGADAQDIYLVLKDAQGNKLNLMFEVEAWRQPAEITGISITPETAEVTAGARMAFEAQVSGTGTYNAAIAWSVSGQTSASTRMEENTLILGRDEAAASLTVTAASVGNPLFTAEAEVTVLPRTETILPAELTAIESEAFEGADFQAVVLGGKVVSIGGRAFANCASLIDVTIPESVISIAYDAFAGCRSDLVILGTAGSPAEAFADQQGYIFEILP